MVVPYTPGGYTDLMARTVGQKISEALGQPIVFENRPGANAIIGTDVVAKAAPDGYTFGTVIAAHAVNATLNPKLPYDTMKDFTYVSLMSVAPLIMIAHPSVPANNMKELIALAKAKPGELNFASSGVGAAAHLTMEMFKSRIGIDMQHVPYKGTAGALQDTVGGRINVMFDVVGPLMPQVTRRQRQGARPSPRRSASRRPPTCRPWRSRACRISSPAPGPASSRRPARRRRSSIASPPRPKRRSPIRR